MVYLSNIILLFLFSLLLITPSYCQSQKCYALAMEGGGDKGAWQVGALKSIIKRYPDGYDVLSGVSVGALNGGYMSMYTKEQEAQAIIDLEQLWLSMNSDSVYKHPNLFADAYRTFFSRSLFDNTPLKQRIAKEFGGKKIQRPVTVGVTDFTNGVYLRFDADKVDYQTAQDRILASSSIPGIFPYMTLEDKIIVDGGVMVMVDIPAAIARCHDLGYSDSSIVVDVLLCNMEKQLTKFPIEKQDYNTLEVAQRYQEMSNFLGLVDEVVNAMIEFPEVSFRNVLRPSESLTKWRLPLDFKLELTKSMIALGEQDAINQMKGETNIDQEILDKVKQRYEQISKLQSLHKKLNL